MRKLLGAVLPSALLAVVMVGCTESATWPDPGPPSLILASADPAPLVQYDFNNVTPNVLIFTAPSSSIDAAAVTASGFSVVPAAGAPCDFGPTANAARNGVNVIGSSQHMSFVLGHLKFCNPNLPTNYPSFEFSLTSLIGPIQITSISFLAGTNPTNTAQHPTGQPIASIIEYRTPAGPVGSDAFSWFRGFPTGGSGDAALAVTVTPTGLVLSGQPTTFKLRFNQIITGESFTTQVRIEDVEVKGVLLVNIDIKPGSDPNSINLGSKGNVPVVIFSTPLFDATTVDPSTITLADATVKVKGKGTPMASFQDVDGDGLTDIVVHVETIGLALTEGDTEALLAGATFGGTAFRGTDFVRVVP